MPHLETILSVSPKEGIDVWDIHTGTHVRAIQLSAQAGAHGPVLLDEEHIAIPQFDRAMMLVINWKSGQVKIRSHLAEHVKPMAITHDGQYLAAGAASGKVYIWHVPSGECVKVFDVHYKGVSAIAFTDDDAFMLTGGDDGILNVWILGELLEAEDLLSNKLLSTTTSSMLTRLTPHIEFSNHSLPITNIYCGVNASGGGKIITSSLDRTVKIYNIVSKSMTASFSFPSAVTCVTMDNAETFMCVGSVDHNIYKILLLSQQQRDDGSLATTNSLASLFANMQAKSTKSKYKNALAGTWPGAAWGGQRDLLAFEGHTREVTGLTLSINGNTLCSSAADGTLRVWDVPTRTLVRTLTGNRATIGSVRLVCDVEGSLNVRHERYNKKTFPHFTKFVAPALPLASPMDTVRPGATCGTLAYVTLPHALADPFTDGSASHAALLASAMDLAPYALQACDDVVLHAERVGQGMVTSVAGASLGMSSFDVAQPSAESEAGDAAVQESQSNGKKRKASKNTETSNTETPATDTANKAVEKSKSGKSIEELEAEVKKWKATAADLYKKLNSKK